MPAMNHTIGEGKRRMRQLFARLASAVALSALCASFVAGQQAANSDPKSQGEKPKSEAKKLSKQEQKEVREKLEAKAGEMDALKVEADGVTKKIGELVSSGKLTSSDEALKLMQQLVEELSQIRQALQKVQEQVADILGYIEGQKESMPVLISDVDQLKKNKDSNYVQFQYADTQEGPNSSGGANRTNSDGFAMRRFRIGVTDTIDPKTSMKLSFDVASGSQRTAAELKDAVLMYDIVPSDVEIGQQILLGQQNMGLGYELERSSSEREFAERALYNRTMFVGERNRGIRYRHGLGNGWSAEAGIWSALTVSDPQQNVANTFRNLVGTTMANTAALRYAGDRLEYGVSMFSGKRPGTAAAVNTTWRDLNGNGIIDPGEVSTVNIPATQAADRRFYYLDFAYVGLLVPQLTVRAEAMMGKDRVPTLNANGTPVSTMERDLRGWHTIATYNLNPRNQIHYKYEFFDPNTGANDNSVIQGLAWTYWMNPGAKIVVAHEFFKEQGFERKNDMTTLRVQFKF